jgi:hypothetical protein
MKRKVILFALIVTLLAGLLIPALATAPAYAAGGKSSTTKAPLGPLMIGLMTKTSGNNYTYKGIADTLYFKSSSTVLQPSDLSLANLSIVDTLFALDLNLWTASIQYDTPPAPGGYGAILSGTLTTASSKLPKGNLVSGVWMDFGNPLAGNYLLDFSSGTFGSASYGGWGGLLVGNLSSMVSVLPKLFKNLGGPDITFLMPTLTSIINNPIVKALTKNLQIVIFMPVSAFAAMMGLMM